MSLPEFCVRRPVTTIMAYVGAIMLGFICVARIPQELFPEISFPQLTVVTSYANAAPEEIENLITTIIEESISTVRNLKRIRSSSREGLSMVTAEFTWDTNMDFAALAMREKIDLVKQRLPKDSEEPIVKKLNPFARPTMLFSITSDQYELDELLKIVRKFIKDKLEKIDGVASASISGGREREILVQIDKSKLRAVNVDLLEISKALKNSNLNYPAGTTKEKFYEYLVRTIGEFKDYREIGETVIGMDDYEKDGANPDQEQTPQDRQKQQALKYRRLIQLKDVANIQDTFKEQSSFSRINGVENISIAIQKQSAANAVLTARKVLKELEVIGPSIPKGVNIELIYNEAEFITASINGIRDDGWQGTVLAFFTLLFFLRLLRPSIIISISIPVGVMIVLTAMYFGGISINMMSLMGMALSIGNIVDSSVVVLDNITRHREEEKADVVTAAIKGSNEVVAAIAGSTFSSVAVFLPMFFLSGIEGQLFRQLAFTVIWCNLASLIVAITLVPKLYAQGGNKESKENKIQKLLYKFQIGLDSFYVSTLKFFLAKKIVIYVVTIILLYFSFKLMGHCEKELLPKVDQGQFLIELKMPTGTRVDITNSICREIEEQIQTIPEVLIQTSNVGSDKSRAGEGTESLGSHEATISVTLKKERERMTPVIMQDTKSKIEHVNLRGGYLNFVSQDSAFGGAIGGGVQCDLTLELMGLELDELEEISGKFEEGLRAIPGVYGVRNSVPEKAPETKVFINKDKAGLYDLSANDIALTSQIAIKGIIATNLKESGVEIPVRVKLNSQDIDAVSKIKDLWVHSPTGVEIPLKELASESAGKAPSEVRRLEQRRVVYIYANQFGRKVAEVETDVQKLIDKTQLPEDYSLKFGGESAERAASMKALIIALGMAILLIYMLMAAQFESLLQPFIIMFSVPFSLIGVAVAWYLTRTSINAISMLGIITLEGIVVNTGIVMFECINDLRASGMTITDAIVQGCRTRLRPILMTTLTTILGLLPLAFGLGEGGELKQPLGVTVFGGLFVSTILTLFIIPSIYQAVEGLLEKIRKNPKPV